MSLPTLALTLFGPFEARFNDQPFTGFATDKVRALLAYLAVESGQAHRRDTLAALLWPDYPHETALRNLRQAIYRLRLSLQEIAPSLPDRLLVQTRRTIALNPEALFLDTAQFARQIQAAKTSLEPIPLLTKIVNLYRGELLKGFYISDAYAFDEWVSIQRELFQQQALDALSRLVTLHEADGNAEAVLATAQSVLALDSWHEKTHRQIMRAHLEQGNRPQAITQYNKLRAALRDDLGVEPDPATMMLYKQIRADNAPALGGDDGAKRPSSQRHFPATLTPLIGRKAELDYLSQTLQDPTCRLLTITAPGGMGKTRLALETARRLSAQSDRFPDGLFFVSLAQVENDSLFISAIAQSLSLSVPPSVEPRQALLDHLKSKRLLILLDNFEHLLGRQGDLPVAVAFLAESLTAAPEATFLITSREPLALQGEWVYSLGGLPYIAASGETSQAALDLPASQLFIQCARRYRPAFDPAAQAEAIGEICRLTGGLPLALEIAAAWMRSYDCQEIARLIAHGLDFLTNPYRDAPPRQRSIRAIFTSTWEQLSPEQQTVLAAMSVFRTGFTVQAAVFVAEASVLDLAILVEKSLLRRAEERRYDLHELVYQFAAEKLAAFGAETAVSARHAAYYLTFLREQFPGFNGPAPQEAIALARQAMDNIRAAWQWAVANRQINLLRPAVEILAQFLVLTSNGREGEETFAHALHSLRQEVADDPEILIVQSLLASHLAWFQIGSGKKQAALENVTNALALAEQGCDLSSRAYTLSILGWGLQIQSRHDEAEVALTEAIALFEQTDNPLQLSLALIRLGSLYWRKRELTRTLPYYERSLQIEQRLQNKRGMNRAYGGIGLVYEFMGKYDEALPWLQKALALDRELENQLGITRNLGNLGSLYYKLGDYPQALLCYQEAAKMEQEGQRKSDLGTWHGAMGDIYRRLGEEEQARRQYDQAIALHEETGDRFNLCTALLGKGELYLLRGDYEQAGTLIQQGKRLASEIQRQEALFRANFLEASLLVKMGNEANGRQQLESMLTSLSPDDQPEKLAQIYDALWQIDGRAAYARQALAAYQKAFALAPRAEYRTRIEALAAFGVDQPGASTTA
jgi:DNA-binding SARP family transcriptional activator/predicted ATPase/Flp pilus assembly protein TadD